MAGGLGARPLCLIEIWGESMNEIEKTIYIEISHKKIAAVLILSALFFIISILLWIQKDIDNSVVIWNNYIYENESYLKFFKFISRFGMGIISLMYSILIFLTFRNKELGHIKTLFLFVVLSFAMGSVAGDLLKEVIGRSRPVVELSGKLMLKDISDTTSFPSGHATKSMGLALPFIIMALNKGTITKIFKALIFLFAILVCYSRIALQKHFLSDVLAGIAIALFFVFVAIRVANYMYKRKNTDEIELSYLNKKLGFIFTGLAILLCLI